MKSSMTSPTIALLLGTGLYIVVRLSASTMSCCNAMPTWQLCARSTACESPIAKVPNVPYTTLEVRCTSLTARSCPNSLGEAAPQAHRAGPWTLKLWRGSKSPGDHCRKLLKLHLARTGFCKEYRISKALDPPLWRSFEEIDPLWTYSRSLGTEKKPEPYSGQTSCGRWNLRRSDASKSENNFTFSFLLRWTRSLGGRVLQASTRVRHLSGSLKISRLIGSKNGL